MQQTTREAIKSFVKSFMQKRLSKMQHYTLDELKRAYPFHNLFFVDEALIAFKLQRSIVTAMGRDLYPKIARLIALDKYQDVHLDYELTEELDINQCNKIEEIVTALRIGKRRPDHRQERDEVFGAKSGGKRTVTIIADLYIGDFPGGPFFAEIKTPLPNLDICAESKKKLLYFWAIMNARGQSSRNAYLAFPYNPYIKGELYAWKYTPRIMDMKFQVLIAEEFWDKIGGPGAFDELLNILSKVKEEIPIRAAK